MEISEKPKEMIIVFEMDQILCVTEENSDTHNKYIELNNQDIKLTIDEWKKPFTDRELLIYNVDRDSAHESDYDLEHFIKHSHGFYKNIYNLEGLDGVRNVMKNKCYLDVYRGMTAHILMTRKNKPLLTGNKFNVESEDFQKFKNSLTEEDIFMEINKTLKYTFKKTVLA